MGDTARGPFEGPGGLVVMAQITHEFSFQIEPGAENAMRNHVALEFGKPKFDLVKPRRVSGCVMQFDFGMAVQKLRHPPGFMGREVIGDDVNLATGRLMRHQIAQESDKLGAGMARRGLAHDFSAANLQSGKKRESAVPVILKTVAFRATRRKRQHRIEPVEGPGWHFFSSTQKTAA